MIHNGIFSLILDGVLVTPRKPNYKESDHIFKGPGGSALTLSENFS